MKTALALLCVLSSHGFASQEDAAEGFANPDLLVTTEWLAENGSTDDRVIVDVRGADEYAAGHIAGAIHLPTHAVATPVADTQARSRTLALLILLPLAALLFGMGSMIVAAHRRRA